MLLCNRACVICMYKLNITVCGIIAEQQTGVNKARLISMHHLHTFWPEFQLDSIYMDTEVAYFNSVHQ